MRRHMEHFTEIGSHVKQTEMRNNPVRRDLNNTCNWSSNNSPGHAKHRREELPKSAIINQHQPSSTKINHHLTKINHHSPKYQTWTPPKKSQGFFPPNVHIKEPTRISGPNASPEITAHLLAVLLKPMPQWSWFFNNPSVGSKKDIVYINSTDMYIYYILCIIYIKYHIYIIHYGVCMTYIRIPAYTVYIYTHTPQPHRSRCMQYM